MPDFFEMLHRPHQAAAGIGAIFLRYTEPVSLHLAAVVVFKNLRQEQAHCVSAKIGGQVTDSKSLVVIFFPHADIRLRAVELAAIERIRGEKLHAGIIRLRQHREGRRRQDHIASRDARNIDVGGPLALLLPQMHPVLEGVRLLRVHSQTFFERDFSNIVLPEFLE